MRTFHIVTGSFRLTGLCASLAVSALGGFVTETPQEFLTTADLDGDGRPDIVVVDKPSGTFRAGYQFSDDLFTWSESRGLGGTNLTGITTGPITDTAFDAIAVVSPLMNRVHLIEAQKDLTPAFPIPVFGNELGPKTVVSQEIGGGTAEADLVVINSLSAPTPYRLEGIESSGASFNPLGASTLTDAWVLGNSVPFYGSTESAAFIDRNQNALRMFEFSSGSPQHLDSIFFGAALTSPDYCPIHPNPLDYVHYIVWDPGTPTAYRFHMEPGEVFSALDPIDFGGKVISVQTVNADGADWLLVTYSNGAAAIFSYTGKYAPEFHHSLSAPQEGTTYAAALQTGPDRFTLLSADQDTGIVLTAELFEYNGSTFEGTGAFSLPAVTPARGRANVFTFRNEPFVDAKPERLQALSAGDWSTKGTLFNAPMKIGVQYETDQGIPDGLGNADSSTLGLADTDAKYILVNQAGDPYSIHSTEAASGYQWAEAFINPAPGHYRTGIEVTLSNSTGDHIYYRLLGANVWNFFTAPIPLFEEETILFYAKAPGGQRSPIQTAAYSFEAEPGQLDSDGDSIPDYVELANGLNPLTSGLDGDGDGFSDLEELIAGSDPTDPSDVPSLPILGTSGRLEQLTTFNLQVAPLPYDGTQNDETTCATGTALRVFSPTGWQYGYSTALNHGTGGVTNPSVLFTNVPSTLEGGFFTVLTDRHFAIDTPQSNKNIGIEMAAVAIPPSITALEVTSSYAAGDLTIEAFNWVDAARTAVSNSTTPLMTTELIYEDLVTAMLTERKLVDEMVDTLILTNRHTSLFPGRVSDATMEQVHIADLVTLRNRTNTAFLAETVIGEIEAYVATAEGYNLRAITEDLYDICSEYTDAEPGAYPLPMSVLRSYFLTGILNSNYVARMGYTPGELSIIYADTTNALAQISTRTIESQVLTVREGSFTNACPVLYTAGNQPISLYDAEGRPYIMPFSFELGEGARLLARGFSDIDWNRVPGSDPLEIISLRLTAVPVSSDQDSDGNLLPDAFENTVLNGTGNVAHLDSDGDGYSDLQEYLDGTDPSDDMSFPAGPIVDLHPPQIILTSVGAGQVQLDIQWPADYAAPFEFSAIYSNDLTTPGYAPDHELPPGTLSTIINTAAADARFFKVVIRLR